MITFDIHTVSIKSIVSFLGVFIGLFILTTVISCKNEKVRRRDSSKNIKVTWGQDSSCLILKQFYDKHIKLISSNNRYGKKMVVSGDSTFKYKLVKDTIVTDTSFHKGLGLQSFFGPSDLNNVKRYGAIADEPSSMKGTVYSSKPYYDLLYVDSLNGDRIDFLPLHGAKIILNNSSFKQLYIVSTSYKSSKTTDIELNLDRNHTRSTVGGIVVQSLKYRYIDPGKANSLYMSQSMAGDSAEIVCSMLDSLVIRGGSYAHDSTKIILSSYYIYRVVNYIYYTTDVLNPNQITNLYTESVDFTHLVLDYQYFKYIPNRFYEENRKNFGDLIRMQRKLLHYKGAQRAIIDSTIYEDRQKVLTVWLVPVKLWWNNYGFDRPQVLVSTLEVFAVVLILNFIFFTKLLEIHPLKEIANQLTKPSRNNFFRVVRRGILCTLYSGYIFFGLRFDVKTLRLDKIGLSLWIIFQYLSGLVCLAYVANLIIGK